MTIVGQEKSRIELTNRWASRNNLNAYPLSNGFIIINIFAYI